MEKKLDRRIYENAISTMRKFGISSIMSDKIYPKKDSIMNSLLSYYESTEEFEKCKFIKDFFNELEEEISKSNK